MNTTRWLGATTTLLLALTVGACSSETPPAPATVTSTPHASAPATPEELAPEAYVAPTPEELAALPEARYDAVIPGLSPYAVQASSSDWTVHTIAADAALYGADKSAPVARLAANNFLDEKTVIVAVRTSGAWTAVLTPARRELPSQRPASATTEAAAQTIGWIRTDLLDAGQPVDTTITIRIAEQTLTVSGPDGAEQTFSAGVGTPGTPTPTGVTGYIQARYLDPAQNQDVHPIQLTSLHSSTQDEPYGGQDGGLIGIHYQPQSTGAVSHGCIRLTDEAITAVDATPLGTPVIVLP